MESEIGLAVVLLLLLCLVPYIFYLELKSFFMKMKKKLGGKDNATDNP